MRKIIAALAISALALGGGAASAKQTLAEKGEAKLAKLIEGRTAGEPVNCIFTARSNDMQVIDHTAVVYGSGKTIYVARPTNPRSLGSWDVLVVQRTNGTQLCTNDILYTVDQGSGFRTGAVFLESFIPYTRNEG